MATEQKKPDGNDFTGFLRGSKKYARWMAVVQGTTEQEAFQRLLAAADKQHEHDAHLDLLVLPTGEKP